MWLMASELPIRLEILDQAGQRLFDARARLKELDDTHAVIALDEPQSGARVHWGSPVRFEVEDGMRRYELTGAIVAREAEDIPVAGESAADESANAPTREFRVHIWECKLNVQRRSLPRRKLKFPVNFRPLCAETLEETGEDQAESIEGWCVDIGPGGIRVRAGALPVVPARMSIEFSLPVSDPCRGIDSMHRFQLTGRVIRAEPQGRQRDSMEIALKFERLSVRDGLVLHNLLS